MSLNIALVTSGLPFNGSTLETGSLGGSETALLCMARELVKRGNRVTVFCECDREGLHDGVTYFHLNKFTKVSIATTYDVLIVSRYHDFLRFPTFAGLRVLWCHDILTQKEALLQNLWQTDMVMLLSDFHIADYTNGPIETHMPYLKPHIWKTSNGVDYDFIQKHKSPIRDPKKLIYTSRPERGLNYLLTHIFPALLQHDPELTLYYANYDVSKFPVSEDARAIIEECEVLVKQFGERVVGLGHLTKADLYREISSSQLMLYPTSFPEIFCITALEAAACGTPFISTKAFALTETVGKNGILVPWMPGTKEYNDAFINAAIHLLEKPKAWERLSEAGPKHINTKGFRWDKVAEKWEKKFTKVLKQRWENNHVAILSEMERNHDLVPARALAVTPAEKVRYTALLDKVDDKGFEDSEEVVREFEEAIPRFKKLCNYLATQLAEVPQHIVDFACGYSSFGLFYVRANPTASATLIDRSPAVCAFLEQHIQETGVADRVAVLCQDTPINCQTLFVGDWLETQDEPWTALQGLAEYVNDEGHILFSSGFGPDAGLLKNVKTHHRKWNLGLADYYDMVASLEASEEFGLTLLEEGISDLGDLTGHWIGCFPKMSEVKPIDLERRKRIVRPYKTLAAALIAKDEEENILKCLKSIRPVVDSIYLTLDTRTSDRTEELVGDLVDEVRHVEFQNFGSQRNASVANLKEDWILWIDCDEALVDAPKLRRYLHSEILNGYAIRQNHLMLDVQGTYDIPIRVYKNKPHYKFTGYVHEHCEDTEVHKFGNPIRPTILLADVDIAHYGYPDERRRRFKCSNRNMELLVRDWMDNGRNGRDLSWVLVIRDFLNVTKWIIEHNKLPARPNSIEHKCLEAAVSFFLKYFDQDHPDSRYYHLAYPMYQEALAMLGMSGLPFQDRKSPPFEVGMALWGNVGGLNRENVPPEKKWFIDAAHYLNSVGRQNVELVTNLGIVAPTLREAISQVNIVPPFEYNENDIQLLELATNIIDQKTGQLKVA